MRPGPRFLGIGAQKAATTWLDACLRRHPQIWLPPLKELHYFDDRDSGDDPAGRPLLASRWSGRRLRRQLVPRLRSDARHLDVSGLRWDLRYFFGRRSDRWYLSLFPRDPDSVAGEITPDYSILDAASVARVHAILPDVKLILLMRDPIDRSWSQIRMDVARAGRPIRDVPHEELVALARSRRVARRSDYDRTLRNWGSRYADGRFFIGFMEDVRDRPEVLLADLCRFLGVDASPPGGPLARRRVHAGESGGEIPPGVARELARLHLDGLRALEARFGGPVRAWRERAERLAG
ncbi:MAG TPA: sulfotransferase [Gemmatimonadota bacterium]